jgi:hypothetical protein
MVTVRVGSGVVLAAGAAVSSGWDAVPDGDLLGADEDVLDEQPEDSLAFGDAGVLGAVGGPQAGHPGA